MKIITKWILTVCVSALWLNAPGQDISNLQEKAGEAAGDTVNAITEATSNVVEDAAEAAEASKDLVTEKADEVIDSAVEEAEEVSEEISDGTEKAVEDATDAVQEIGETAAESVENVGESIATAGEELEAKAEEVAKDIQDKAANVVEDAGEVVSDIKDQTEAGISAAAESTGETAANMKEKFDELADQAKEKAEEAANAISESAEDLQDSAAGLVENVTAAVTDSTTTEVDGSASTDSDTIEAGDESATEISIDERINNFIAPLTDTFEAVVFWPIRLGGGESFKFGWADGGLNISLPFENMADIKFPFVLVWLLGAGLWATLYFGFPNLRYFGLALKTVSGKYSKGVGEGEVSHFKALTTALSATVGLGNITGVAVAIGIGGPGAVFWMILAGIIGMSSKFVECTLGVKFRQIDAQGKVHGGPMYYLSEGFRKLGLGEIGTLLGGIFALMCVGGAMGGGNIFQVNSAAEQIVNFTINQEILDAGFWEGNRWIIGAVFALVVGLVIIGGLVWIANVTSFIVPFMCGIYVITAITIIVLNIGAVPGAVASIFKGIISPNPDVVTGGIIGALIAGFQRAAFSNEAGIGSAPIAHSGVKTRHPASEGIVALLEPFIDTVVVCSMTALVIIIALGEPPYTSADGGILQGIELTTAAFKKNFGWMGSILTLCAVLFAFSTMISWCYYGMQSWTFLFGKSTIAGLIYKCLFLSFVVIGSAMSLDKVIGFSDAMIFAMAFPNVFAIVLFSPMVKAELRKYLTYVWDMESGISENSDNSESAPPAEDIHTEPSANE